jgi:thioredoxin 1
MADTTLAVDGRTLEEEVAASPVPVLVEFTADWCPPCRMMAPVLEAVAAEVGDGLRILTLDADDHPDAVARYQVLALPTMLVFRDGVPTKRLVGARSTSRLLDDLADVLG